MTIQKQGKPQQTIHHQHRHSACPLTFKNLKKAKFENKNKNKPNTSLRVIYAQRRVHGRERESAPLS